MGERGVVVAADRSQRVDGRRQARGAGQLRQAFAPPGRVLFAFRLPPGAVFREVPPVVEGEFAGLVVGTVVEAAQVGQEDPEAHRVAGHHVQVDLQSGPPLGKQAQGCAEDVAGGDVGWGVGVALTQQPQFGLGVARIAVTQVVHGEGVPRCPVVLPPVLVEDGPQHAVAAHQSAQGGAEPVWVDVVAVELDVEVGGDTAERLAVLASDPVGVLHRRQREGFRLGAGRRDGGGRAGRGGTCGAGLCRIPLCEQGRPGAQGRSTGEVLEGDRAARATPGTDQGHQRQ